MTIDILTKITKLLHCYLKKKILLYQKVCIKNKLGTDKIFDKYVLTHLKV